MIPTAEQTQRRREMALALLRQGADTSPVQHWTQGLARVLQAGVGGWQAYRADEDDRRREAQTAATFSNLPGLGGRAPAPVTPSAAPAPAGGQPPASPASAGRIAPASIRTNNPGAMYPGPSARSYGTTGTQVIGGGHKIAVFPDAQAGAGAMFDLLRRNYSGLTLDAAIRKWSGGNNADTYIALVTRATGLPPNARMADILANPQAAVALARAMSRHEAGREYPLTEEQWLAAYQRAAGQPESHTAPSPAQPAAAQPQQSAPAPASASAAAPGQAGFQIDPQVGQYIQTLLSRPETRQYGIQLYNALVQKYASRDPGEAVLRQQEIALKNRELELQDVRLALERAKLDPARTELERAKAALELQKLDAEIQKTRNEAARGPGFKEYQTKDAIFAERLARTNAEIDAITRNYNPASTTNAFWWDNSLLNSQEWRLYQQAAREGIAAILRKDTGAAVTETEWELYFPMLYPQPGDGPEVVEQKRRSREAAAHGLAQSSGGAYRQFYGQPGAAGTPGAAPAAPQPQAGAGSAAPARITSDAEYDALPSGTQFMGPDGKLRVKP